MCVYNGEETAGSEMIQCCLCLHWYHLECVNLNEDHTGFWPCPYCRTLCSDLRAMKEQQDDCKKQIMAARKSIQELCKNLASINLQLNHKNEECDRLAQENNQLRQQVHELSLKLNQQTWSQFTDKPSLLIGDSLVSDVDSQKLHKTEVLSMSGATIEQVNNRLSQVKPKNSFRSIAVCVGTNDCSNKSLSLDDIMISYSDLIDTALTMVPDPSNVVISAVPPRTDDPDVQRFIEELNSTLPELTQPKKVKFVNLDKDFKVQGGDINDALLQEDGFHLTNKGSTHLVKALEINVLPRHVRNVCKPGQKSMYARNSHQRVPRQTSNRRHSQMERHLHSRDYGQRTHSQTFSRSSSTRSHGGQHAIRRQSSATMPSRDANESPRSRPACWYCGEHNHVKRSCRHGQAIRCHHCGTLGHKSKFCGHQ